MRRLRAAAVPIAFYVGAALLFSGLAMLSEYPLVRERVLAPDFERAARIEPLFAPCSGCVVTWSCMWGRVALLAGTLIGPVIATLLGAIAWLGLQRRRGMRIWGDPLGAAGLVVLMSLLPPVALLLATLRPGWGGLVALVALAPLGGGVWLSLHRPLFVSRLVSAVMVVLGLIATLAGFVGLHDVRIVSHPRISPRLGLHPLAFQSCQAGIDDDVVYLWEKSISFRGDSAMESEELDSFIWQRLNGDPINLAVSPRASLERVRMVLWEHQARGGSEVMLIAWQRLEPLWTLDAKHRHACGLKLELSDDGVPITDFADWPALLRAADHEGPPLKLRVR